jgi:hypothetical protein
MLNQFVKGILLAGGLFLSAVSFAHEGVLKGPGVDLKWIDHTLFGVVDEKPVFADSFSNEFGVRLLYRKDGTTFSGELKRKDSMTRGQLDTVSGDASKKISFSVTEMQAEKGIIKGKLDNDDVEVKITSDEMDGHHFVKPKFEVRVGSKSFELNMTEGAVCIGCSVKIIYSILSVKRDLGLL